MKRLAPFLQWLKSNAAALRIIGGVLAAVVLACWGVFTYFHDKSAVSSKTIQLSIGLSGKWYREEGSEDRVILSPNTPYLAKLNSGGLVDGEDLLELLHADEMFISEPSHSFPAVHFRVVNNSDRTIIIDRLRLEVIKSRMDPAPLIWTSASVRGTNDVQNGAVFLGNDGWGQASDVSFGFDILGEESLPAYDRVKEPMFVKNLPNVPSNAQIRVELGEELASRGAELSVLSRSDLPFEIQQSSHPLRVKFDHDLVRLKATFGVGPDERLFAIGNLKFRADDNSEKTMWIKQEIKIVLPDYVVAPAIEAVADYDVELRPEGLNYQVDRVIAHQIRPGGAEAIAARVFCQKSSFHEFRAAFRVNGKWIRAEEILELHYYRPTRSSITPRERAG